ncbi:MAG: glutamine--tRNA ligase/YqeY domain fusion protein [Burkholderiales bacterium]
MSDPGHSKAGTAPAGHITNFIRNIVEADLAEGKHATRRWSGKPGPAHQHAEAALDPAKIRTRFPPEPNGYLHFGHAKSICLNFGLARDFAGACHMRFDDTNPTKEEQEYVDSIVDSVHWLGFDWKAVGTSHLYYASDYFQWLYDFACAFIEHGLAYVDSQSSEEMRANRGSLTERGKPSPYRDRSVEENLDLFRRMKAGEFTDGAHILRLKIDMSSPNINLRDPGIYRIRHAHHHRNGDAWCIYPLYDYTHCISDALENITHSICTLEFEDHRPLYDWVIEHLAQWELLQRPLPHQYEFARLNLSYVVLSKRKLIQLVEEKHVEDWDDPRLPTLVGARRRGYTPEGFRLFADRIGVSKSDSWIDFTVLEDCMRDDLNERAERRIAVLRPIKLVIDNYPEGQSEECLAPNHPQKPELGKRPISLSRELWIDADDFAEVPLKGFFRLAPGTEVRLRYAYIVKCVSIDKDAAGNITTIHCTYDAATKSGATETRKVKGNIHWLDARTARSAYVRLYDRLFAVESPGAGDRDFLADLNPKSKETITAYVEPAAADAPAEAHYQFERHGYFVADRRDHAPGAPVYNRAVTLRDSWGK